MTEQSDKPSVDELMRLVHQYIHDWQHSEEAGEASEKKVRAYVERLAALAGPLEQPQEPTSDKANLAQASGVCDLQTALPRWIPVSERLPEKRDKPYQVFAICLKKYGDETCYPGEGKRGVYQDWVLRQWPQNYTHWCDMPPIAGPSSEPLSQNKPAASSAPESSLSVPKVCRFPDCRCPMDPGPEPDWCAIGLPHRGEQQ